LQALHCNGTLNSMPIQNPSRWHYHYAINNHMLPTELHCQESGVRRRIYCDI